MSFSIKESIWNAIYVLRPFWKCFQFQGHFDFKVGDKLPNNAHLPQVIFRGSDVKPTVYETRNCYPVQSSETFRLLDERLDELIKSKFSKLPC